MYPEGVPWPIGFFILFLETIGIFIKSMVLSLRIFANMFAGHLAILSFLVLIFVLSVWSVTIAVPFAVFVYLLELLVALIQAFVFTLLSCIFIHMSSCSH
jgi:F-type H+-transporting ATPase subunit a